MANTSNTFRDDPLRTEHHVDGIGVHPRHTGGQWPGWLLPLLAVLALLALAYWALSRRHRTEPSAPAITPNEQQFRNQVPAPKNQPEPPGQPGTPQAAPPPPGAPSPGSPQHEQQPQGQQPEHPQGMQEQKTPNEQRAQQEQQAQQEQPQARQQQQQAQQQPQARQAQQQPQAERQEKQSAGAQKSEKSAQPAHQAAAYCGASFSFPVDEKSFTSAQREKLDELASCLKASPSTVIELEGRAHPVAGASDDRTESLALSRAQMIEKELERRGVPASQLRAKRAEPFCTNSSADCLAKNRSVVAVPAD